MCLVKSLCGLVSIDTIIPYISIYVYDYPIVHYIPISWLALYPESPIFVDEFSMQCSHSMWIFLDGFSIAIYKLSRMLKHL